MAFLRRGYIRVPHKLDRKLILTKLSSWPITVYLKDVSCFEEHAINDSANVTTIYFLNGSMIPVREHFDAIDAEINGKAVAP